jgi:5'-methylthioinosine phosphorylase
MAHPVGIVGGSGLSELPILSEEKRESIETPYGSRPAQIISGHANGIPIVFVARHGAEHRIAPHEINYRANIWALKQLKVSCVIAVAAVGGIRSDLTPGSLVVPDQIIDYTWSRCQTFFEGEGSDVVHVDFTWPYHPDLRRILIQTARDNDIPISEKGTYAITQGPRLESAAEVDRLERDGADIVGMTGMPEAVLAKELEIPYATLALVVNWAAGRGGSECIEMDDVHRHLEEGMSVVAPLLGEIAMNCADTSPFGN